VDGARVPAGHLNLLHRDDAASALRAAAAADRDLYLAVDDEPVHRHALSRWLATLTGRDPGRLVDEPARSDKRCSNGRLRGTGWTPTYPTFRAGYAAIHGD
jgi:nucleoside-diphosphate-sugar epimerase